MTIKGIRRSDIILLVLMMPCFLIFYPWQKTGIIQRQSVLAGINTEARSETISSNYRITKIPVKQLIIQTVLEAGLSYSDAELFYRIAKAESTLNPNAVGYASNNQVQYLGLFQIAYPMTWNYAKCTGDIFSPVDNTKCAINVLKLQGLGAWEVYTKNVY